jgi:hypothetical protein
VPTFCRHNRLIQNCPICSREQSIEARPIVSSSAPAISRPRSPGADRAGTTGARSAGGSGRTRTGGGSRGTTVRVRRLARGQDDGYRSELIPGVRSSADAERLADELAFAQARLELLEAEPPGLYAEVAGSEEIEERTWLAFLIAYLGPQDGEAPFADIARHRTAWSSEALPDLADAEPGPRGAHAADRGARTVGAYRAWAARAGSQAAAFTGEPGWTPERRFARVYERLSLPGLHRDARYELLTSLGRLGVYELRAGSLALGGENEVTIAAKRALGIGDPILLERRAQVLAEAANLPLEALDVGFFNWERGERAHLGAPPEAGPDPGLGAQIRSALGL